MTETRGDTILDLIRHGEPLGGKAYRGHSIDDPLSERGWKQMWSSVQHENSWQHIVTSPLERCHAFARELASERNLPLTVDERFKEIGFGQWEGKTRADLLEERAEEFHAFYQDPIANRPAGAEPVEQFVARVRDGYENIHRLYRGKHVLLVAHAGVIRALITLALSAPPRCMYKLLVSNASISRIRQTDQGISLEFHNWLPKS